MESVRGREILGVAAILLAVLAPAQASFQPVVYYLKDGDLGPLFPGRLDTVAPPRLYIPPTDPVNYTGGPLQYAQDVANNLSQQSAQSRLISVGQDLVLPVQFVTPDAAENNTGRIYGPVLAFLVLPQSPLIQHANLSVEMVALTNGTLPFYLDADVKVLASAEVDVDGNDTPLPDPANFIPPNSTDPEAAAAYVAGQLLSYGITTLVEGYKLVYLDDAVKDFIVDATVPPDALIGLRLRIVQGSSTLPIPEGLAQAMVYNTTLTPDLLYFQWYKVDPPRPTPTTMPPNPSSAPTGSSSPRPTSTDSGGGSQSTPAPVVPMVALGLAAAVLTWRRRHK